MAAMYFLCQKNVAADEIVRMFFSNCVLHPVSLVVCWRQVTCPGTLALLSVSRAGHV